MLGALLGGLGAGAAFGAWIGALAVRENPSLQGGRQAAAAIALASCTYAVVLGCFGVLVALSALPIGKRAEKKAPRLSADLITPLAGMLTYFAVQRAVHAFAPWRAENDPLVLGVALALAFAGALVVRVWLRGAPAIARFLPKAIGFAVGAGLTFVVLTLHRNAALPFVGADPAAPASARVEVSATPRVMLIGVDGADWARLMPLIEAGRLPNFARMCDGAYTAPLSTIKPTWSPVVWNTIATGVLEHEHGVLDFTEVQLPWLERGVQRSYPKYRSKPLLPADVGLVPALEWMMERELIPEAPVTALQRRRKAFWDILAEHGVQTGVVRWWATWPATKLDGYVVSDNDPMAQVLAVTKDDHITGHTTIAHMTWPHELSNELLPLIDADGPFAATSANPIEHVLAFAVLADLTESERVELRAQPGRVGQLELIVRGDQFATRAGLQLWNEKRVSTLAVYLRAVDNVSHRYWNDTGVVDRTYELTDQLLGDLLDAGDADTTYMLVSDHGWNYEPGPTFGHNDAPPGVLILRGPGVVAQPASKLEPSVIDIAPTLLALYGLPPESAFRGRPLRELFAEGTTAAMVRAPIESYGDYRPQWPATSRGSLQAGQRQAVDLLRGLGYLGD